MATNKTPKTTKSISNEKDAKDIKPPRNKKSVLNKKPIIKFKPLSDEKDLKETKSISNKKNSKDTKPVSNVKDSKETKPTTNSKDTKDTKPSPIKKDVKKSQDKKSTDKKEDFSEKIVRVGKKLNDQRHMSTMRDAFATIMPLVVWAALSIMINHVFILESSIVAGWSGAVGPTVAEPFGNEMYQSWKEVAFYISPIFEGIANAVFTFFSIYLVFLLGYFLTRSYGTKEGNISIRSKNTNAIFGGVLSILVFLTFSPYSAGHNLAMGEDTSYATGLFFFGINGMITTLLVGLTVPMVFVKLEKKARVMTKVPRGVPTTISNSFAIIIPIGLTILIFALIQPIWGAIAFGAGFGKETEDVTTFIINYEWNNGTVVIEDLFMVTEEVDSELYWALIYGVWNNGDTVMPLDITQYLLDHQLISVPEGMEAVHLSITDGTTGPIQVATEVTNEWYYLISAIHLTITEPIERIMSHPASIFFIILAMSSLWFFGLHGSNLLITITEPIWGVAAISNAMIFNKYGTQVLESGWVGPRGEELEVWTKATLDSFVMLGGAGATLALVAGLFVASKSKTHRNIAKTSALPSVFQINEPVTFGLPIMMNPLYAMPFILVPPINAMIAYFITNAGLVNPTVVVVPWMTPVFLGGFISTLDWRSLVLTFIIFSFSFFSYLPFIIMSGKHQVGLEKDPKQKSRYHKSAHDYALNIRLVKDMSKFHKDKDLLHKAEKQKKHKELTKLVEDHEERQRTKEIENKEISAEAKKKLKELPSTQEFDIRKSNEIRIKENKKPKKKTLEEKHNEIHNKK